MSKGKFGYFHEGSDPFFIERPIKYPKEEHTATPFKFETVEEIVDIPLMGMFIRYNYRMKIEDKIIEQFNSLEILTMEQIDEQFEPAIKKWFDSQLTSQGKPFRN